mgnify:CR=1 FL=1
MTGTTAPGSTVRGDASARADERAVGSLPAYFSHHKCATMYATGILSRICRENGLRFRSFDDDGQFGGDLRAHLEHRSVDFLAYINARWQQVRRLEGVSGVHVIRDPRDILVSAYFSHLRSHETQSWPDLVEHRRRLREVDKREGLFLQIDFISDVFEALRTWDYGADGMLELTFEELTVRPYRTFLRIFEHLGMLDERDLGLRRQIVYLARGLWNQAVTEAGLSRRLRLKQRTIPGERLLAVVYQNRFGKKTGGRARGEEDRASHYRKGVSGDWREHLETAHVEALRERFPGLLRVTGYARTGPDP